MTQSERDKSDAGRQGVNPTQVGAGGQPAAQGIAPLSDEDKARRSPVVDGYVGTPEQARRNAEAQERVRNADAVSQIYDEAGDFFSVIGPHGTIIRHIRAHDPDIADHTSPQEAGLPDDMLVVPPPFVQSERGRRETDEESTRNRERDEELSKDERYDAARQAVKERDEASGTLSRAPTPDQQESQRRQDMSAAAQTAPTGARPGSAGAPGRPREDDKDKDKDKK